MVANEFSVRNYRHNQIYGSFTSPRMVVGFVQHISSALKAHCCGWHDA